MLARSLNKLQHPHFGFLAEVGVVVSLTDLGSTYTQPQLASIYRQLEDGMNRLPGVTGSGLALYNPLTDYWGELILVSGHPAASTSEDSGASWDRMEAHLVSGQRRADRSSARIPPGPNLAGKLRSPGWRGGPDHLYGP